MAQVVKFGNKSVSFLKKILSDNLPRKIFLVTGKNSFINSGARDNLEPILNNYCYFRFFDFESNPKVEDVERGVYLFNQNKCDLIIAVGGGSVIDMAKLINIFHSEKGDLSPYIISNTTKGGVVPFVALPTTSGTGSEATHFAVVYVDKKKYSVANNLLLPDIVLINPSFTFNASPYLTAVTGLDAFSQAIESYWSVNSNKESKEFSKKAIKIIWNNLPLAVNKNDNKAKERISLASHLAGKAINITKTTAPHAISYPFTTYYAIPHGHAVALTLSYFMEYNYNVNKFDCNDPRGSEYVKKSIEEILNFINLSSIKKGVVKINEFLNKVGIDKNLTNLKISKDEIEFKILKNINIERLNNNPRKLNFNDIYNYLIED